MACLFTSLFVLTLGFVAHQDPDDLAAQLPRIAPTESADALATFQLVDGFRLDLIASEPIVSDPVAACYDEDSRLYVVEMRGYPFREDRPAGRVRLLKDLDGDRKYETATTFLDGLPWPTAVVPWNGGVFIAAAPDIIYARDDDGDGKADTREIAFTGFGHENVQALVNGLCWGPDGWIHGASGGNGGAITSPGRPEAPAVSVRGRDFRFKPDGSAFEPTTGGGQFGLSFDDWGHKFVCNNSRHLRQVVMPLRHPSSHPNPGFFPFEETIDIVADGAAAKVYRISPPEPWRVVRTRQRAADPAFVAKAAESELVPVGFFTSASGVTIYRGSKFPPESRDETRIGTSFVGDVGGNLVHRDVLIDSGPHYQADRADEGREFLASTDNWFRPVNFLNTPDGTLLILDMYREAIEHPASIPEPIKAHLDLTSGRDRGRVYELAPSRLLRRPRTPLGKATAAELVQLLGDPDAWWRETAERLLIERGAPDFETLAALHQTARVDHRPLARRHAISTLRALDELTVEDLLPNFRHDHPRLREWVAAESGWFLQAGPAPELLDALIGLADDPDKMVRLQVALSLGESNDPKVPAAFVGLQPPGSYDDWLVTAIVRGIHGRELAFADAVRAAEFFPGGRLGYWRGWIAESLGFGRDPATIGTFLDHYAGEDVGTETTLSTALSIAEGMNRAGGSLADLADGPGGPAVARAMATASKAASSGTKPERPLAIRLLGHSGGEPPIEVLSDRLDPEEGPFLQQLAVDALGRFDDPRVAEAIIDRWDRLVPEVRREAGEVLLARPERTAAFLEALEAGRVRPFELDPATKARLIENHDPAFSRRASAIEGVGVDRARADVIARYREAIGPGDLGRGHDVYLRQCASCHRVGEEGAKLGPELATVSNRSPEELLVAILDPNREVAPEGVGYQVATRDGRIATGSLIEAGDGFIVLGRPGSLPDEIARSEIEEFASTGRSLMPEGLEATIDPAAMSDLIAFIRSIGGGP